MLAAGVAAAGLDTHQGAGEAQGKKPHQGIFSKNRGLRVGEMWLKWSGTHQDRSGSSWQTVSGSALDANGNTLSDAQGRSYTWDFENRLTQVVNPGVGTTTFRYDPFGRRIQKISPTTTSIFVYDDSNLREVVLARASGAEMRDPALAEIVGVRLLAGGPGFELPTRSITVGAPSLRCWQGRV